MEVSEGVSAAAGALPSRGPPSGRGPPARPRGLVEGAAGGTGGRRRGTGLRRIHRHGDPPESWQAPMNIYQVPTSSHDAGINMQTQSPGFGQPARRCESCTRVRGPYVLGAPPGELRLVLVTGVSAYWGAVSPTASTGGGAWPRRQPPSRWGLPHARGLTDTCSPLSPHLSVKEKVPLSTGTCFVRCARLCPC